MANTVLLRKPLNIAQDAIQDYFDLFYELNSIEINDKFVTASLELSDTPGTNTKTIRIVYATETFATAQIEAYIALGYTLIKTQSVGNMIFAVLTINGTVKVYKALLSQAVTLKVGGNLTIGKNYRIAVNTTGNFTNVGAADNNVGTQFVATGIAPTAWGNGQLWETPEPVAVVLKNTAGINPVYQYSDVGEYKINLNQIFSKYTIDFSLATQFLNIDSSDYADGSESFFWLYTVANNVLDKNTFTFEIHP